MIDEEIINILMKISGYNNKNDYLPVGYSYRNYEMNLFLIDIKNDTIVLCFVGYTWNNIELNNHYHDKNSNDMYIFTFGNKLVDILIGKDKYKSKLIYKTSKNYLILTGSGHIHLVNTNAKYEIDYTNDNFNLIDNM